MSGSRNGINNMRQNHPELIVRDLEALGVRRGEARRILKYRGVNKWFAVRRLLIQLKNRWLQRLKALTAEQKTTDDYKRKLYLRGYRAALVDCRQQVRALCHSTRDVNFGNCASKWPTQACLPESFPVRPSAGYLLRLEDVKEEVYR
jgi:hypothetical protein